MGTGLQGKGFMKIVFKIIVYLLAGVGLLAVGSTAYFNFIFDHTEIESYQAVDSMWQTSSDRFTEYMYFDTEVRNLGIELPAPPTGEAELMGNFVRDGKPVKGIELSVILNGEYKKSGLITDGDGRFGFTLPSGDWRINGITVESWIDKAEGDFMVVSGSEAKINSPRVHDFSNEAKKQLTLSTDQSASLGTFVITERIEVTQPTGSEAVIVQEPWQFELQWNVHPKVLSYLVDIQSVTRQGSSSTYLSVYKTTTENLSFSLDELTLIPDENETFNEYAVNVKGYDANGVFVSKSGEYRKSLFKLKGLEIPDSSEISVNANELSELKNVSLTVGKINAASVLLDENMITSAEQLIATINEASADWRFDRIQGYLAAKKGNCGYAKEYFDLAKSKSGFNCIPSKYKVACHE
jgi:hypothetical protein